MAGRAPALAWVYAAAARLAAPALLLAGLSERRGGPATTGARFGRGGPGDGAPRLWLHGASVGEAAAARVILDAVSDRAPDLATVLTTHTVTGRLSARLWAEGRASVRLAPWDTPGAVKRFRRGWSPAAYVFTDSELWPNRILDLHRAGATIVGANARLSERSAARWARLAPGLARALLSRIDLLCPQDGPAGERFVRLGLPPDRLGPDEALKSARVPSTPLPDEAALRAALPRARTVLAASTHPGEERMALEAFRAAGARVDGLRLILAPRHPHRAAEIAGLVRWEGFVPVRRTQGAPGALGDPNAVYIADTVGELRRFYAMSALAFVGGSMGDLGGHTPFEPVAEGCAIAHGPDTANAEDAYRALERAEAAIRIADVGGLADAFARVADPVALDGMTRRAALALAPADPVVPPLVAERVIGVIRARQAGPAGP